MIEALPCSGYFTTCMGAHFLTVDKDNVIRFSIVSNPLNGVKVPVASFQMDPQVQLCPSIYIRALSVSM